MAMKSPAAPNGKKQPLKSLKAKRADKRKKTDESVVESRKER